MKKVIILALLMIASTLSYGQDEYNKWAVSAETGSHSVSDASALVDDNYNHFGLDLRYNINEIVGVGVRGAFDNLSLVTIEGNSVETDYLRLNAEATVSVFEILKLRHKNINLLFHGGPGASFVDVSDGSYNGKLFNMSGGMTALLKLSRSFAFKVDYSSTIHLSQDRTLDGAFDIPNAGVNSVVDNLSVGLVYYWGKGKKKNGGEKNDLQHADWYSAPTPIYEIIENITQVAPVTNITQVINNCDCSADENVYFENDEDVIEIQGLNAIEKVANLLALDAAATVELTGSASPTATTSIDYDLDLSERRVKAVRDKLINLGVSSSRITTKFVGKDIQRSYIHEFARKVSLIVK
jgi:outer membrane protein OmpA-like peptidoglycan-associated protein